MSSRKRKSRKHQSQPNHVTSHKVVKRCTSKEIIDDVWVKVFSYLNVYDFCAVRLADKHFHQVTDENRKKIREYWKYQSMLLGCNEMYHGNIYDNTIKPTMSFFSPPNNNWKQFYIQFYKVLSESEFISKISLKTYYNYIYTQNMHNRNENYNKHKNKSKGKGKGKGKQGKSKQINSEISTMTCFTFMPHSSQKKNDRSRFPTNPTTLSKYMSKIIHFNINGANSMGFSLLMQSCLHNYIQVVRYLLTWDEYICNSIDNNTKNGKNDKNDKNTKNQTTKAKSKSKRKSVARLSLCKGGKPNGRDPSATTTALSLATNQCHYQLIKYLLTNKRIGNDNLCWENEFRVAFNTNDSKVIDMYLDPNINIKLGNGTMKFNGWNWVYDPGTPSALHYACRRVNSDAVKIILDTVQFNKYSQWKNIEPVNINLQNENGATALMNSINQHWYRVNEIEHLKIVKLFLNQHFGYIIDLFIFDTDKRSIFVLAVDQNYYHVAMYIFTYFKQWYKCSASYRKCVENTMSGNDGCEMIQSFFDCAICLFHAQRHKNQQMIELIGIVQEWVDNNGEKNFKQNFN